MKPNYVTYHGVLYACARRDDYYKVWMDDEHHRHAWEFDGLNPFTLIE
jgi:hypothetical protein